MERWDGRRWRASRVANAHSVQIDALSCTSVSSCFAVGALDTEVLCSSSCEPYTVSTLQAEHWDGMRWSRQRTPNPNPNPDAGVTLTSVSCPSDTACVAVGPYANTDGIPVGLAERWDGANWAEQSVPNPNGETDNEQATFNAVSCVPRQACIAVGSSEAAVDVGFALAEDFDGAGWTVQATVPSLDPFPGDARHYLSSALDGVSCSSVKSCMAVGTTDSNGQGTTLAERWNGVTWTLEKTPIPPRAAADSGAQLYGISCSSATACTAVGYYYDRNADDFLLAERWDGRQWSYQRTPRARGADASSGGVSCPLTTFCMLVEGPRTERWDGTRWTIVPTPARTQLAGVSCTSRTQCVAVGRIPTRGSSAPPSLLEVWNGHAWHIQTVPTPVATTDAFLTAISCPSRTACTAVGAVTVGNSNNQRQHDLAERWDGKRWTILATPASDLLVSGLSCTSSVDCVAVGSGGQPGVDGFGAIADG